MVYSNKFVAVVVCKNQIVREIREDGSDQIYLPFGSDYSLRFKNQHSTKAVVNVEIDGKDVLDGDQLVVSGGSTSNLEGFMIGGKVNNAFRFIEKTQQVAKHRGDFIDDGFIRITWKFEEQFNNDLGYWIKIAQIPYTPSRWNPTQWNEKKSSQIMVIGSSTYGSNVCRSKSVSPSESMATCNVNDCTEEFTKEGLTDFNKVNEGITVAGKDAYQEFRTVHTGQLENVEHSIIIHLLGKNNEGQRVSKPKMTRSKVECPSCGTRSRSDVKFCPNCGTNVKALV